MLKILKERNVVISFVTMLFCFLVGQIYYSKFHEYFYRQFEARYQILLVIIVVPIFYFSLLYFFTSITKKLVLNEKFTDLINKHKKTINIIMFLLLAFYILFALYMILSLFLSVKVMIPMKLINFLFSDFIVKFMFSILGCFFAIIE